MLRTIKLTKAIYVIQTHLSNNYPNVRAKIPPGLSKAQIKKKLQILPYKLPLEIYELYQFCGGWNRETENWDTIFAPWYGTMTLRSLTTIIEDIEFFATSKISYMGKPLVPIFGFDRIYLCVVGDCSEQCSSPILYVSELNEVELHYVSLTTMIQTVAESWQNSSFNINNEGFIECDEQKFFTLCRKYNPELPQMVLSRLKDELEITKSDDERLYEIWNSVYENVRWLTMCWQDLSIEQLNPKLIQPIVREINKKNSNSCSHLAKLILAELSHQF